MRIRIVLLLAFVTTLLLGQLCMMPSVDAHDAHSDMQHETHESTEDAASSECARCFVHAGPVDPTITSSPDTVPVVVAVIPVAVLPIVSSQPRPTPTSAAPPGFATHTETVVLRS